jgi:hypothetical protein
VLGVTKYEQAGEVEHWNQLMSWNTLLNYLMKYDYERITHS